MPRSRYWHWVGAILCCLAVVGISAALNSLCWQLQTQWSYTPGECRVVTARVMPVGSGYELYIEHQVEIGGRRYRPTRNTEQYELYYNNLSDAEESLARYAVGTIHPCWYDAADPDRHSVLVSQSMDTGMQLSVLMVSLGLGILGLKLILAGPRGSSKKIEAATKG